VAVGYSSVFARGGDVAALPGGLPLVSTPWAVLTAQSLSFVWTLSLNSRRRVRCESLFCLVTLAVMRPEVRSIRLSNPSRVPLQ
jgi:hypothetical protein